MKQKFKKSKETMVTQWLVRNIRLFRLEKGSACDIALKETYRNLFTFTWNGVSGSIICEKRVKPSSLNIFTQ